MRFSRLHVAGLAYLMHAHNCVVRTRWCTPNLWLAWLVPQKGLVRIKDDLFCLRSQLVVEAHRITVRIVPVTHTLIDV